MPNTADVTVTLSLTGAAPPDDTWKHCKNADGDDDGFWYKFTGGNTTEDDGSWEFDTDASGNSNKFIDININAADGWDPTKPNSQGYRITSVPVTYAGDVPADKQDISIQDDSDPRSWRLKDKNKDKESGEYKVIVSYTSPGTDPTVVTDIECDPAWRNK